MDSGVRHSRQGRWWLVGGGLLVVALVMSAVIVIPRVLHVQRVAAYAEVIEQTHTALDQAHQLRIDTELVTVLYSLQFDEARALQPELEELEGLSDHYFATDDLEALTAANDSLIAALEDEALTESEVEVVTAAKHMIDEHGYIWQTGFLNLAADAVEELVELSGPDPILPVTDDDVTDDVLAEARNTLVDVEADLLEAERSLDHAKLRADSLIDTIAGVLKPLSSSALSAPEQAEVVLEMYPSADQEIVKLMRDSAQYAADSVSAEIFTVDDDHNPVPVVGDVPDDKVSFSVTDAWRTTIITTHLKSYSGAVTGAWISDAGSVEDALGFNPYLPFF